MLDQWWIWVILAYLSGSVSYALLLGKMRGVDIREHGSGNVGATNAGRVLGRKWGVLCFVLDVLKGAVPVALAGWWMGWMGHAHASDDGSTVWQWQWLAVAVAGVLGHVFPIWLKFKGGKGVATGFGVLLGFYPMLTWPVLLGALTWAIFAKLFRYVSLASMVAAVMLPIYLIAITLVRQQSVETILPLLVVTGLMALLVVVRHTANIKRLLAGTESRLGKKAP